MVLIAILIALFMLFNCFFDFPNVWVHLFVRIIYFLVTLLVCALYIAFVVGGTL